MTNKEKAREISLEYAETDPMDNCNCFPFRCAEEKASYHSALSMAEWKDEQYIDMEPILLTRDLIEHNGWRLVMDFGDEDLYGKRVREGKDNDEYIVSMHVSQNNEVCKVDVCKVVRIKGYGEYRDFVCMLKHTRVCVHTFQNLLNLLGLKETSEEFNIM